MAATEFDILRDEQERSNLLKAILDLETAIATSMPSARRVLENTVENAKKRITTLDKKIEEAKVEHAAEVQAQVAAAALAAKETALSTKERETYRGFLEESYFTKKDFGRLDEFYTHSYDRLSENGKTEMSKRFWKGVEHGEYQFGDAPSIMQQKEAERAKRHLGLNKLNAKQLGEMSNEEQRAFAEAYVSDNSTEAKRVLARNSIGGSGDNPNRAKVDSPSINGKSSSAIADIDLNSVDLKTVRLIDANPSSPALIPDLSGSRINVR